MTQKSEMPTLAGLAKDMAFLVSAPAGADLSRLQGALRILIEMTRYQEREACAKVCDRHATNQARHGDTVAAEQSRQDAVAIRARSNAELTGAAPHGQQTKPQETEK